MAGLVKLGLWGGDGGSPRDIDGYPTRLSKIVVRSGQAIDSLYFEYVQDGKTFEAGPWGGSGGRPNEITFEPGEYLTAINGTTSQFSDVTNLLRSLTFVSNVRKYGPFGPEQGTPFSVPIANGRVVGFYGRSGTLVDAIGIYLMPN
ncbi:protein GOS9-like [Ananas comosus]|uniref:Protein GOS9-like n=1 Tax=Ananas comosus TaxID=4615 RepID=A0A6P5G0C3_ANACO|nr:protein GOS9-like [Ananas comosus]